MERPILAAILSCSSTKLTDSEKYLFEKHNPLGINLFGRNIENPTQLKNLTDEIKNCINRDDVIIAIDQEGGRVRRLVEPHYPSYASQSLLGRLAAHSGQSTALKAVQNHAVLISRDLHLAGINLNYAPCVDLYHPDTTPALKSRSFGTDKNLAAQLGKNMVETYINQGICPCIKHMPGLGRAQTDPHLNLPINTIPLKELAKTDFYPFKKLNKSPAGMTAHIILPEIDDQFPITQSKKGIETIIRGELGFDGFLISDAIDMHSLKGNLGQRAKLSLEAGCDCISYCFGDTTEIEQVIKNSTIMRDKSLFRFESIKKIFKNYNINDNISKIAEDYQSTIGKIEEYNDNYDATEVLHLMRDNKGES